jgi:hypothetical protein
VHANTILGSLAADFESIMADVTSVANQLNGARDASAAIARNAEDAWRRLPELRDEYDKIRSAQTSVVVAAFDPYLLATARSSYIEDELASDVAIANLDELLPSWKRPDNRTTTSFRELGDRRPWPIDDPLAQLVWLVTSNAKPWLPTEPELRNLHAERAARINKRAADKAASETADPVTPKPPPDSKRHDRVATTFRPLNRPLTDIDD